MEFDLTDVAVRHAGPLADTWLTLRVHERLRDGGRIEVGAVASLQLFLGDDTWKISGHAWHALTSERIPAEQPLNVRERGRTFGR
ncbi:MAG TPA: hypothetical protein VLK65_10930 [Vicinamibacteria bacterium]|nr:hypothetical protein [Vicinamibacteria bacterium]